MRGSSSSSSSSSLPISRRTVGKLRQVGIQMLGSVIKLLLFGFVALTLIALAKRNRDCSSSLMGWTGYGDLLDRSSSPRGGYTIVMNTWKRYDLLKKSISHYASCPRLQSIHIVWSEPDPPSDSLKRFLNHVLKSNNRKGRQLELNLLSQFGKVPQIQWWGMFLVCIGWIKRRVRINIYMVDGGLLDGLVHTAWYSKAAFFHKKYLKLYTDEMPSSIKEYITKNRNCEDIAMSLLVANASGAPPIWVKGKIFEIGSTGISSLGGHTEKRTECVNKFVCEFGRMPLVPTSIKSVDSRNVWFW